MRNSIALLSLFFGVALTGLSASEAAPAGLSATSSISVSGVSKFCQWGVPYAKVNLLINASDRGLPGLVYVGSHDPGQTAAEFLYDSTWQPWNGSLYPPFQVFRSSLQDLTILIPLDRGAAKLGWSLYVGYGALTAESERKVERMILSYQTAKAKFPERQIATVDPDHFRRTLIQTDMTDNAKYRHVMDWTGDLLTMCAMNAN